MFQLKILISLFFLFPAFGEKSSDVVIVNTNTNKSAAQAPSQTVIAPALNPSKAKKLRNAREDAEVQTESLLLEQVEKERLKSEQKLLNKIFGSSQQSSSEGVVTPQTPAPSSHTPPGVDRVYVSAGLGIIQFYGKTNVESFGTSPCFSACFLSIGGAAQKYFLFDFSVSYSRHYLKPIYSHYAEEAGYRTRIDQPMASIAIRLAPWTGKIRPYAGISVAYINRRESTVNIENPDWKDPLWQEELEGTRKKGEWVTSFDGGLSGGMDISLGPNLGLNIDLRYHWNLDTEDTTDYYVDDTTGEKITNFYKAQSFIASVNLRFYF